MTKAGHFFLPRFSFFFILGCLVSLAMEIPPALAFVQNGGFETGSGGAANRWTAFTGGTGTSERRDDGTDSGTTNIGTVSGLSTRTNTYAWYANASGASNTGGAYQDVFGVNPGDSVSFSGFIQGVNVNSPAFANIRIEFLNNAGTIVQTNASASIGSAASYTSVSATGTMPGNASHARLTFSTNLNPDGSGDWAFDDLSASMTRGDVPLSEDYSFPVTLSSSQSSGTHQGDVVTISTTIRNASSVTMTDVELVVEPPAGFDFVPESARRANGTPFSLHDGTDSVIVVGSLGSGSEITVVFQLLVTSIVQHGHTYDIKIYTRDGITLGRTSAISQVVIRLKYDPLFEEGTILGKVFDDRNEDGVQSKGEIGLPRVRIYTEYGVGVVTDSDGRFHIPAVQPGRHVLKLDGHTIPPGTAFITEESLVIKTTPGLLNKVRFAVRIPDSALPEEFRKDLQIWVTQGMDLTQPLLQVSMEPDILKIGPGRLQREPTFRIKTNYSDYIAHWQLEIQNELGQKIWIGIGISQPPSELVWNGMTDAGEIIPPGIYAYRLVVRDGEDHQDWTPLEFFRVARQTESSETLFIPSVGNFNVFKDGKRAIPLAAKPTVRVYGKAEPGRRVRLGKTPIETGPDGEFEEVFFVTPGEKKITVSASNPEGDTMTVEEKITVKESYFFLVALGEEELGLNAARGNLDSVGRDDTFHEDFYEQGRLAYFLKARIKGKFLVKSRYDTGDRRKELFTQLDPDSYYPVYGDHSQIDYEGQETTERLFLLVEMDRSFLRWGSFQTDFTDTELGRHNRTLSGLKLHHETLSTTKYGEAKRAFSLFWSKARTLADHNEFRATGGSLYYLRNRNVIQGSEKIRVETRDKIQDIPLASRDLVYGKDYEIDYKQGRILLTSPLSSVAASETIISNDILDGNPVFLIVDYEFENFRVFSEKTLGLRGYTHLGNNVRVGGTVVEEKRSNSDYDLRAVDATFRTGRNTKVTAEFAQAKLQQVRQSLSFDGGLSFRNQDLVRGRRPREKAYLIKGETKPLEPLELSGYLQDVEPGFSVDWIRSQEGYRKYGIHTRYKVSDHFYLLGRHDSTEVVAQLRPLSRFSSQFEKLRSTTAQAVFDDETWKVTGEYLHQHLEIPIQNRIDSLYSQMLFRNAAGLKIGRRVSDWLTPYLRGQLTFSGKQNYQMGGGVEVKAGERAKITFEEMMGNAGDATLLGVSIQQDEKTTSYVTLKSQDNGLGGRNVSTSIGSSHQLSERSRIYTERQYSTYSGNLPLSLTPAFVGEEIPAGIQNSDIYGYETRLGERWDVGLRFERRHLDPDDFRNLGDEAIDNLVRTNTFNTLFGSLGYTNPKKLKWDSSLELRLETNAPEIQQWVTQNTLDWQVHRDLSFLGRTNFGTSRLMEPGDLAGRFIELNAGFAYRPVESDRFNMLTRYTYLEELANDVQFVGSESGTVAIDERAHILAWEGAYEMTRSLQVVEKLAYRMARFKNALTNWVSVNSFLWVNRVNYHVTRKWDLGIEYRMLFQLGTADNLKHGSLVELDRELYGYIRLGIGYNFTDFGDDLRGSNSVKRSGFFMRMTGKV